MSPLPVLYDVEFAAWQIAHTPDAFGPSIFESLFPHKRSLWFDKQGQPITIEQWGELRQLGRKPGGEWGEGSYCRIALDDIGDVRVSTVWLGLDGGYGGGPPVIFETMVFGGKYDQYQMRYCTEWEAIVGHGEAVADIQMGMAPWWSQGGQESDEWRMEAREDG